MNKLVLIDGNSVAFRAFYALPLLSNSSGFFTNAVYGFTMMLLKVLEDEKPTHVFVAFDAGKMTFRHAEYKEYKQGRAKTPPEISEQFPLIKDVLDAFGIPHFELDQYEADDIIGTFVKSHKEKDLDIVIVSGDKDLFQLIDERVHVLMMRKGVTDALRYDAIALHERYGLVPHQFVDLKGLMGDTSDNIPGIPGVGEKTAIKLLSKHASVEEVVGHADDIPGKLGEKVRANKDQALVSKKLATIFCEVPLELTLEDLAYHKPKDEAVISVFQKLEFKALLKRMQNENGTEEEQIVEVPSISYEIITMENQNQILDFLTTKKVALYVEGTQENPHRAEGVGISISCDEKNYYIPIAAMQSWEEGKAWLRSSEIEKVVIDVKRTKILLERNGLPFSGGTFDILLASYLLNPSEAQLDLSTITQQYLQEVLPSDEEVYGKGAKRQVLEGHALIDHISRKALLTQRLYPILLEKLKERDLEVLFTNLELPLSYTLCTMEQNGVGVDRNRLNELGSELKKSSERLSAEIYQIAGMEFNINSPKQLGFILFEKLGLPPVKKTKTGYSTDVEVLDKLASQHEIAEKIVHFRQVCKLLSTYIEGLGREIHEDEKIHTQFNQTITATGRLSSSEPNLQNIPIRMEEGRRIRQVFIPSEEKWLILAADYSQIELRVLAHLSEDESLQKAFKENRDIHTHTAMDVFGVSEAEVTSEMRRHAKAVNFGIVYGQSDFGLSQSLNISRKEAKQFIERYFETYPGVKEYMDRVILQAKQQGYVTTLLHRRRYLPEINSSNFNRRSFAERTAMNTPIQGTAADIIKYAMVELDHEMRRQKLQSKMVLTVHDELVFEVPESELQTMKKVVCNVMESSLVLSVPLKVDMAVGRNWYEAK